MERLTLRSNDTSHENGVCCTHFKSKECLEVGGNCAYGCKWEEATWERLAAYEDTGLEPERCAEFARADAEGRYIVMRDAEQEGVARLRELAKADKDGRCIVLPCKVGDTVYEINRIFDLDNGAHDEIVPKKIIGYGGNALNKVWLTISGDYCNFSAFPSEFGKTIFSTREEAERAMEGKKDG